MPGTSWYKRRGVQRAEAFAVICAPPGRGGGVMITTPVFPRCRFDGVRLGDVISAEKGACLPAARKSEVSFEVIICCTKLSSKLCDPLKLALAFSSCFFFG